MDSDKINQQLNDEEIAALSGRLDEKEARLRQLAEKEQALQIQLADQERRADFLSAQLFEIRSSRLWRLFQSVRNMRTALLTAAQKTRLARAYAGQPLRDLQYQVETEIPPFITAGKGSYLYVAGWCFHPVLAIRRLSLRVGESEYAIRNFGFSRRDVLQRLHMPQSLTSGFWGSATIAPVEQEQEVEVSLVATLENRERITVSLGKTTILPQPRTERIEFRGAREAGPLVAICMATYEPPLELFTRQINSLIQQTHQNWVCVINDDCSDPATYEEILSIARSDSRFFVFRNEKRLGHYYNFERALERVPKDAAFVAFCDQDDEWYPSKVEKTLAGFQEDSDLLVYCDMDVVAPDHSTVSTTYWTVRRNNYESFEALLFANTVTGAALIFRASLLPDILPFPPRITDSYHDHWVASAALAKGRIRYIDAPLYAYHQHENNAFGHEDRISTPGPVTVLRRILSPKAIVYAFRGQPSPGMQGLERDYREYLTRLILLAKTLLARCPDLPGPRRTSLKQIASAERHPFGLLAQAVQYVVTRRPSLGLEVLALGSYIAHQELNVSAHITGSFIAGSLTPAAAGSPDPNGNVDFIRKKIGPLHVVPSSDEPKRVNVLLSTIDFSYVFGGYLAMFNLAQSIALSGYRARIVIVDSCNYDPANWRTQISSYEGLEHLFDLVETSYHFDRSVPLPSNPEDVFVATSWWTAHIASAAAKALGREKIVFFAQDYEPIFYARGSLYALSAQSYDLPQFTVFSTGLLQEYFQSHQIGVFRQGQEYGEENSAVFENAISSFEVTRADLEARTGKKRLLFYARPEPHASRNLFELGILGIAEAIRCGDLDADNWDFYGIGTLGNIRQARLHGKAMLTLLPKVSLNEYRKMLPTYDLGISLMLSPHPSLIPLEMAAAGLPTITNTYETKTREQLCAISPNIIAVPPTIEGLAAGIAEGVRRVANYDARVAGTRVRWATSWADAFNPAFLERLKGFIERA